MGYPIVPALYIAIMAVVAVHMFLNHQVESLVGLLFIALGAGAYAYWRSPSARR